MATGMMPEPMIAATQAPGGFGRSEAHQHRPRAFGGAEDADGRLGDDAELALGADDEAEEIVAGGVEVAAADVDDRAVDQHHASRRARCWW